MLDYISSNKSNRWCLKHNKYDNNYRQKEKTLKTVSFKYQRCCPQSKLQLANLSVTGEQVL